MYNEDLTENLDLIKVIEDLKENFLKYKNSYNKKEIIKGIIENEDIPLLFLTLTQKNLDDIVIYIMENFSFQNRSINNTEFYDIFFYSIFKNKYSILQSIIKNNYVNPNEARDNDGNTGIILSAIYLNVQTAKLLLKYSSESLELKNKQGIDALTISVYNNDNLMFFLIVNNLTYSIYNMSEICRLAVRNENLEILQYMTANKSYTDDIYLLHHACAQKSIIIFEHVLNLTNKYDEVDVNNETPLHWAVIRGSYHIVNALVKILKENHINLNQKSKFGITPFHLALIKQDINVARILYENGGDVNELDNEGNSIIHMISSIGDIKWLKYVIKNFSANCFQKNNNGNIPFMNAILNGRYEIVEYFIDQLPNLNWKNKYGQTPLHAAVFSNQIKIVELLLKHKADLTIKDINDLTPYHYAYIEKKSDMIRVIHSILNIDKI